MGEREWLFVTRDGEHVGTATPPSVLSEATRSDNGFRRGVCYGFILSGFLYLAILGIALAIREIL